MNKEETILSNIDAIKDSFYTDLLDIPTKEDILNQVQCCIIYLQEEKERLNNTIDKAIEYIEEAENNTAYPEEGCYPLDFIYGDHIVAILKGEINE